MTATSVAMMIGADVSATHIAAEGKSADAGKLFAESLEERIATETDAAAKATVEINGPQIQTVMRTLKSGDGQGVVHERIANANASQAPDDKAQRILIPVGEGPVLIQAPVQQAVAATVDAKAPVADAPVGAATQEPQAEATAVVQDSGGVSHDPGDADVKPLADAAIATPDLAAPGNGKQSQNATVQASDEISQAARDRVSTPATGAVANTLKVRPQQESASASSEKNASAVDPENVIAVKEPTKKHNTVKAETTSKSVDAGASIGSAAAVKVVVAGASVVAVPVVPPSATASTSQTVIQPASKQGTVAAVVTGAQAEALSSGSHQGKAQHSVAVKQEGDGNGASSQAGGDAHVAQKNAQAPAKPVASSVVAASPQAITQSVKSSATLQAPEAAVSVSHHAGAVGAPVNAPGAAPALQLPIALTQKSMAGDAPALSAPHSGNGDLASAAGAQPMTINETHKTLVATPTVLEVGIPNGTQGWLKVRAELTGGGVNASLAAASPAGQEMLHRELPALTTYLQQEKVAVNSLVVQAPVSGGFRGVGSGTGGFAGGQSQQQNQGGTTRENFVTGDNTGLPELSLHGADELSATLQYPGGGGWLSVRA